MSARTCLTVHVCIIRVRTKGSSQKFFVVPETNMIHLGGGGGGGGGGGASQNRKSTDTVHMTCTCMRFSSFSIASCVRFRGRGGGPSTK